MISRAIDPWYVAFLGFLLLPWTTLAYVVLLRPRRGPRGHRASSGSSSASRSWPTSRPTPAVAARAATRPPAPRRPPYAATGRRGQRELGRRDAQVVPEAPSRTRARARTRASTAPSAVGDSRRHDGPARAACPRTSSRAPRRSGVARERLLARGPALEHGAQLAPAARGRSRTRCGCPRRSSAGSGRRCRRRRRRRPRSPGAAGAGSSCPGSRAAGSAEVARPARTVGSLTWSRGSNEPTPTRSSSPAGNDQA